MSVEVYPNKETQEKVAASNGFSGGFPLEVEISEQMLGMTLEEIGQKLSAQFSERGAIGVTLIELRFSMIFNPTKKRSEED